MKDERRIWAYLAHLGMNTGDDRPLDACPADAPDSVRNRCAADHVRTDDAEWTSLTEGVAKAGGNMLVIDLGEACAYPSHPELAVKGTWSVERMRRELVRLRALGLEPIPKLDFSTCHDSWLKDYGRVVATREYYAVCTDLIRDVCEIFDHPRFLHLGFDDESHAQQASCRLSVARQGDLWWHDLLFLARQVELNGARPWTWSDRCRTNREEFLKRMPKSVLQSGRYCGGESDPAKSVPAEREALECYRALDRAGFDQVPTGGADAGFGSAVSFCERELTFFLVKGYMMESRGFALPADGERNAAAVRLFRDVIGRQDR